MLPKEDREIISKIGRYNYNKMKELNMSLEDFQEHQRKIKEERKLKEKIGYRDYNKMKQLGLNYEEYKQYQKEQKFKKYEKKREKDKIRFKTIRYIERYCDLEMKCQECGTKTEVQIHHPNYNDYLKVNLLCSKHHNQLHNFELVPPEIIDLKKVAIKKPVTKEKAEYMEKQIENIMKDILQNKLSYNDLTKKYKVYPPLIRKYLRKQLNYKELEDKLIENGRLQNIIKHNSNPKNPLQAYKHKYRLTSKEISNITGIPLPTIKAIEIGKTDISKVRDETRKKLEKLNLLITTTDTNK